MITVISVITTSKIGIWNIPMRGQNFINNYYANSNNYKIGLLYQEGLMFKNFNMLKKIIKDNKKNKVIIIFTSNQQLLSVKGKKNEFINFFKNYEIHFALDLQSGKGIKFLKKIFNEISSFSNIKRIDPKSFVTYQELFKKYKNKII